MATSTTRKDAYDIIHNHALILINANPRWGATKEHITSNMLEIIDSRNQVGLRYSFFPTHATINDDNSEPINQRAVRPVSAPKHYGVYVSLHPDDNDKGETTERFIGGYTSLTAASHAMMMTARLSQTKYSDSNLQNRSIELSDQMGRVLQRYWIEEGRLVERVFVKEEEWGTMSLQRDEERHESLSEGKKNKHSVLRIPSPEVDTETPISPTHLSREAGTSQPTPLPEGSGVGAKDDDSTTLWCTCRKPDDGKLVMGCENDACAVCGIMLFVEGVEDEEEATKKPAAKKKGGGGRRKKYKTG
ncbi:hypothetical protein T440DRAFT_520673 [Plenodomus tracheiphilus IPT5]|uniref:Uncharacterized protein n=1 Tax=Plenodomus tracheiphilus IPT5 TaxID=1408161 RepID=A0A6A7AWY6_9PLEO|nr:hypothetical protein T440DRAFT_520673 [Plenodomus tracheiphilus IPT5]